MITTASWISIKTKITDKDGVIVDINISAIKISNIDVEKWNGGTQQINLVLSITKDEFTEEMIDLLDKLTDDVKFNIHQISSCDIGYPNDKFINFHISMMAYDLILFNYVLSNLDFHWSLKFYGSCNVIGMETSLYLENWCEKLNYSLYDNYIISKSGFKNINKPSYRFRFKTSLDKIKDHQTDIDSFSEVVTKVLKFATVEKVDGDIVVRFQSLL